MSKYLYDAEDLAPGTLLMMSESRNGKEDVLVEVLSYDDRKEDDLPPVVTIKTLDNNQVISLRQFYFRKKRIWDWRVLREDPFVTGKMTFNMSDEAGGFLFGVPSWVMTQQLQLPLDVSV